MTVCPNCQMENRSGAKFCKNCAARLPEYAADAKSPVIKTDERIDPTDPRTLRIGSQPTRRLMQEAHTDTRPLGSDRPFLHRPEGAIYNDVYLYQGLIFSDDRRCLYQVSLLSVAEDMQPKSCPNPTCGAVFPPRHAAPEIYCTNCGTVLEKGVKDLLLLESRQPLPDQLVRVTAKGLSHGSVRAPLSTFVERLGGDVRHCLVFPQTKSLENAEAGRVTLERALEWGISLAHGLDYLHDNGVSMDGRVDNDCFGLVGERAVWANFERCSHHPEGYVQDRRSDTRALAAVVYRWITGHDQFQHDPKIAGRVNQAFEKALVSGEVKTGTELAQAFENALSELSQASEIYLRSGRYTHVGKVRSLNEDSVLTVEMNRILQSVNRPFGVYVVADGMGGSEAGEVASGLIVNTFAEMVFAELMPLELQAQNPNSSAWLMKAVQNANSRVYNLRKKVGSDMGSTLVAAVVEGNKAYVTHIGDSRAYLVNIDEIRRLTIDHSLVERLVASHQISPEEARYHPQRNVIYRAVGDKERIEVEVGIHTLAIGDSLLLCSDGLSGMVSDETIHEIVLAAESPQIACQSLVEAANAAGGGDNISVIIVQAIEPHRRDRDSN